MILFAGGRTDRRSVLTCSHCSTVLDQNEWFCPNCKRSVLSSQAGKGWGWLAACLASGVTLAVVGVAVGVHLAESGRDANGSDPAAVTSPANAPVAAGQPTSVSPTAPANVVPAVATAPIAAALTKGSDASPPVAATAPAPAKPVSPGKSPNPDSGGVKVVVTAVAPHLDHKAASPAKHSATAPVAATAPTTAVSKPAVAVHAKPPPDLKRTAQALPLAPLKSVPKLTAPSGNAVKPAPPKETDPAAEAAKRELKAQREQAKRELAAKREKERERARERQREKERLAKLQQQSAPKHDGDAAPARHPSKGTGSGSVTVLADSSARTFVYLDGGTLLGTAPVRKSGIRPGRHTLRFWAPKIGGRRTISVNVSPGGEVTVTGKVQSSRHF